MKQKKSVLFIFALVLLGIAVVFTLLGGIGTSCVAFAAENFGPSMAKLIPFKGIFQVLVVVSVAAGLLGIASLVGLARRKPGAYRNALIFLVVGLVSSGVQFYYSLTYRGSTAPNNIRLYFTGLTLLVFLLLLIPGLRSKAGFGAGSGGSSTLAGGLSLIVMGVLTFTATVWAAPTHILEDGINWSEVLLPHLAAAGGLLLAAGIGLAVWDRLVSRPTPKQALADPE
jgi:hypothetical protein